MNPEHDLDAQLRTFFGDADLDVTGSPGAVGDVLAGVRRRRRRRTVAVAATAVATASAAGVALATTAGRDDSSVIPETQDPGYCPMYQRWLDYESGVARLFTVYPTPGDRLLRSGLPGTDLPRTTGPARPSVEPSPEPSHSFSPLPTDKPAPSPPAGCVEPGPGSWQYSPPSPAPWDLAEESRKP